MKKSLLTIGTTFRKFKAAVDAVFIAIKHLYLRPGILLKRQFPLVEIKYALEAPPTNPIFVPKSAFVIHIHYKDQLNSFLERIKELPFEYKFLITVNDQEVFEAINRKLADTNVQFQVKLTPNTGRNFGPFLVEYSKELLNYASFIHVHTKKSDHAKYSLVSEWSERNLDLLMSADKLSEIRRLTSQISDIGLVCADASDLFRRINFFWGASGARIKNDPKFAKLIQESEISEEVIFPIGGMFWARTEAVRTLLEIDWQYSDFGKESGQLDGELQHAVERAFGAVAKKNNFRVALYDTKTSSFNSVN